MLKNGCEFPLNSGQFIEIELLCNNYSANWGIVRGLFEYWIGFRGRFHEKGSQSKMFFVN